MNAFDRADAIVNRAVGNAINNVTRMMLNTRRRVSAPIVNAADLGREDILSALSLAEMVNTGGVLDINPIRSTKKQLDSYVGWVYAAVQILSADIAAQEFNVWKQVGVNKKDRKEVEKHPVLLRPNTHQTWEDFSEISNTHMDLAGKAYWHIMRKGSSAEVAGIEAIPPSWINGYKLDSSGRLLYWKLIIPGKTETQLPAEDVIVVKWPHPTNPLDGASPVQAFALSWNIDMYARAYTGELLQNRAQPSGFISSELEINKVAADTLRERWLSRYGEGRTTEGPAVLGKGATYTPISMSIKDLAFLELANLSRDQILAIYRVPASKLGLTEKSPLASAREAANSYAENALMPRMSKQTRASNTWLIPLLYPGETEVYVEYVSPIRRDIESIEKRSRDDLKGGSITLNEHRETIGKDPDPNGDVYYLPLGMRIVDEIAPRDPLAIAPTVPDDDDDDPDKNSEAKQVNDGWAYQSIAYFRKYETNLTDADFELSGLRFLAAQKKLESKLRGDTRKLFSKEAKLLIASLKEKSANNTPPYLSLNHLFNIRMVEWEEGDNVLKCGLVEDVLNLTSAEWNADLGAASLESLEKGFGLLGKEVPAKFLLNWEIYEETAVRWATENAAKKVKDIQALTQKEMSKLIVDGIESGDSIADISKSISEKFNDYKGYRSDRIARTETADAVNEGKFSHAKESERRLEIGYLKTWNAVGESERSRPEHQPDAISPAQTIPLNELFVVNGESMERPLDPRGSAGNIIHCRCTLTMEVVEEDE